MNAGKALMNGRKIPCDLFARWGIHINRKNTKNINQSP
jgi:hypothetical protein